MKNNFSSTLILALLFCAVGTVKAAEDNGAVGNQINENTQNLGVMKFTKVNPEESRPIYMTFTPTPKRNVNVFLEGDIVKWDDIPDYSNQLNMQIWGEGTFCIKSNVEVFDFRQCYCITDIDLTGNKNLKKVTIGIVGCNELKFPETVEQIKVVKTYMKKVVIPANNSLQKVEFYSNKDFETIDMGKSENLTYLDVSYCPKLMKADFLECKKLRLVDLTKCPALNPTLNVTDMPDLEEIYLGLCGLKNLDLSRCPNLKVISVYGNELQDEALDHFIASLPSFAENVASDHVIILKTELSPDKFKCTSAQLNAIRAKGWSPMKLIRGDDGRSKCVPFKDEDTITGIAGINAHENIQDVWFDICGRRIKKPVAAGVYIHNGKKVMIAK